MLQSMTAYASHVLDLPEGQLSWEIRTVNHRYLDLNLHLPELFREWDEVVREQVKVFLHRGKIDVSIKFQSSDEQPTELHCNEALLTQLEQVITQVSDRFPQASLSVFDVIHYRGVVQAAKRSIDGLDESFKTSLRSCLEQVVSVRSREGEGIASFIGERLSVVKQQLFIIEAQLPELLLDYKQRMLAQFEILEAKVDTERLEQELVWFAQKIDIAEELQRLQAHVGECERIIEKGGVVGRRLDFLMQELNREANTIASKSVDLKVTQAALEIKVALEQIREQVQNIE
ncbi:MAG: YicC family protein [Coxiellaceae bacterium]|nr:YicC family protein [Coxiellaceae bacterium]